MSQFITVQLLTERRILPIRTIRDIRENLSNKKAVVYFLDFNSPPLYLTEDFEDLSKRLK